MAANLPLAKTQLNLPQKQLDLEENIEQTA
jgi:hypothetical protein